MKTIILKPGREKSVLRGHPWIFSGAIAETFDNPKSGETVEIHNSSGDFLAYGAFSPESQIRVRIWSWNVEDKIDYNFFKNRLKTAFRYRESLKLCNSSPKKFNPKVESPLTLPRSTIRLVNAESDGLPGLVVDKYDDVLVTQFLSAGPERWRETLADLLIELTNISNIMDRSDADVRELEWLPSNVGPLRGFPPESIVIDEHGLKLKVAINSGHKTGMYLDQWHNHHRIRDLTQDMDILDCFSYTGGFTLNALAGGAKSVIAVDESKSALEIAQQNLNLNNFAENRVEFICADVFKQLRKFRDQGKEFDMVILDPPKFAPTASHVNRAARGYKDINLLALKLIRPGGNLVTFSCSGGIDLALFQKIIAGAALDVGRSVKISEHFEQSPDHPIALNFPEGAYLKGLLLYVN